MDQELQARIAPITTRLWMLSPRQVQPQAATRQPAASTAKTARRRPGQLIRTSA